MKTYNNQEPTTIQELFGRIASQYDRANSVLSFGLCHLWNQSLVKSVGSAPLLLDLCAGTGEIAFRFLQQNPNAKAILLDFSPEMLAIASKKGEKIQARFETLTADATAIPLPNSHVDAITVAYGIRNVQNPLICFKEAHRVLKQRGRFAILELTRPRNPFLHLSHQLYLSTLLPVLGKAIARNKQAYSYLASSIACFSSPPLLKEGLTKAGFASVKIRPLFGGIATLLIAEK
jgi:demethylmenaquinone methyltransferase/2-methoxy-6-polyprenyl-1,4-benzoquinol methylase